MNGGKRFENTMTFVNMGQEYLTIPFIPLIECIF